MKSPLQQWAWARFRFKGFIAGTLSQINNLRWNSKGNFITVKEHALLIRITRELKNIQTRWDASHKETRRWHDGSDKA